MTTVPDLTQPTQACDRLPLLIAAGVFSALSLAAAIASDGFLEADACTHYMFARFALGEPHYLVNIWGRPLVTGLYAIPAATVGLMGVRATSLLLALLCAYLTYRIAREMGMRRPQLACWPSRCCSCIRSRS